MSFVVNYKKYNEMYSDEEQLIYEDDDDYEGWDDENEKKENSPTVIPSNVKSPTSSGRFDDISIGDGLDNDYFLDRTLSSISTPENRIWNLSTTSGFVPN